MPDDSLDILLRTKADTTATTQAASGLYTAAQLAAGLGKTPQAVRKALSRSPATGIRIVGGVETAAWSVGQLPECLRTRLEATATAAGYGTVPRCFPHRRGDGSRRCP